MNLKEMEEKVRIYERIRDIDLIILKIEQMVKRVEEEGVSIEFIFNIKIPSEFIPGSENTERSTSVFDAVLNSLSGNRERETTKAQRKDISISVSDSMAYEIFHIVYNRCKKDRDLLLSRLAEKQNT